MRARCSASSSSALRAFWPRCKGKGQAWPGYPVSGILFLASCFWRTARMCWPVIAVCRYPSIVMRLCSCSYPMNPSGAKRDWRCGDRSHRASTGSARRIRLGVQRMPISASFRVTNSSTRRRSSVSSSANQSCFLIQALLRQDGCGSGIISGPYERQFWMVSVSVRFAAGPR